MGAFGSCKGAAGGNVDAWFLNVEHEAGGEDDAAEATLVVQGSFWGGVSIELILKEC